MWGMHFKFTGFEFGFYQDNWIKISRCKRVWWHQVGSCCHLDQLNSGHLCILRSGALESDLLWMAQHITETFRKTWNKSWPPFTIVAIAPPQTGKICELMFCPDLVRLQKEVSSVWTFSLSFFSLSSSLSLSWVGMWNAEMLLPSAQRWVRGKGGEGR